MLRVDKQAMLWRYGLDGALREGPTPLDLAAGTPAPFAEHLLGEIGSNETAIVFRRSLAPRVRACGRRTAGPHPPEGRRHAAGVSGRVIRVILDRAWKHNASSGA